MTSRINRRQALSIAALPFITAAGAPLITKAAASELPGDSSHPEALPIDLSKPNDNVYAIVKVQGDVAGHTIFPWSHGEIYGVLPDQMATPMFRYQSCRVGRYFKQPDGSYVYRYRGMIFYLHFDTGELLETYANPITGKTVRVKQWRSSVGEYAITRRGPKSAATFEGEFGAAKDVPYVLPWVRAGDRVWVSLDERVRYKRPSDGRWRTDNAILRYESYWSDITNPDLTAARTSSSWQTAIDWFSWLDMGDTPGRHMQGGAGAKFANLDELPSAFIEIAERTFPGILTDPISEPA